MYTYIYNIYMIMGFWGFGVLGFWGFGVLGFWGFGVLGFWGFGVLGFWGFGVLGGQVKFRESWQKYCRGSDVIIFIVDAADYANIDCARDELHQLLDSHSLANIPLLILGNKNDLEGALNSEEIISQMQLETITERLTASYSISAKNLTNIDIVLKWLSKLPKRKH